MRTICDVCESAAAILFCAADEAALCRSCDEKVIIDLYFYNIFFVSLYFFPGLFDLINEN